MKVQFLKAILYMETAVFIKYVSFMFFLWFQAVDWWSVGVLTYELLTGASPFTVEGEKNTQQEISRRILKTTPPIPDGMFFVSKCFTLILYI